jgi:hypothetical protein
MSRPPSTKRCCAGTGVATTLPSLLWRLRGPLPTCRPFATRYDGQRSARELRQDAVACRVGNTATVLHDEPVHDLAMGGQRSQRPDLILAYQARIARHVGSEDGCQPPLDFGLLRTHWPLGACLRLYFAAGQEGRPVCLTRRGGRHPLRAIRRARDGRGRRFREVEGRRAGGLSRLAELGLADQSLTPDLSARRC